VCIQAGLPQARRPLHIDLAGRIKRALADIHPPRVSPRGISSTDPPGPAPGLPIRDYDELRAPVWNAAGTSAEIRTRRIRDVIARPAASR